MSCTLVFEVLGIYFLEPAPELNSRAALTEIF